VGTNYGFSIPVLATIDGIKVELYQIASPDGPNPDTAVIKVRILQGGVILGTDLGDDWTIAVGPGNRSYGGDSELWGLTWTPAQINSSTFGCALQVSLDSGDDVELDSLRITVYFTE
jgi:hypothetical protein